MSAALKWGQTPWDNLSREELLREVQRYHSAAVSADSVLKIIRLDQRSGFWSPKGSGGQAIAKLEQCRAAITNAAETELYRSFYRYAEDLLFGYPIGYGWGICEEGHMIGHTTESGLRELGACELCKKPIRPISWADLAPR